MEREIVRFGAIMVAIIVLAPLGLLVYALSGDRTPEGVFGGEGNAIAWLSSAQMLVVALAAYLNAATIWHLRRLGRPVRGRAWVWLGLAAGFVLLSADEQLMFHEWLREDVLAPRDMFSGKYLEKGDIGLHLYLGAGLVVMVLLLRELGFRGAPMKLFVAAIGLSAVIVVVDSVPYEVRAHQWGWSPDVNQPLEETGECCAQLLFLLSFLSALRRRLIENGPRAAITALSDGPAAGASAPFRSRSSEATPRTRRGPEPSHGPASRHSAGGSPRP
jgi:hypothetical protein